jgi:hypothetical protein
MLTVSGTVTEQPGSEKTIAAPSLQYARFRGRWFAAGIGSFETTRASASLFDRRSAEWLAAAL